MTLAGSSRAPLRLASLTEDEFCTCSGCESQSVAVSLDYGKSWKRHQQNPLLKNPPARDDTTGWRDPFVSTWESLSRLREVPLATHYMLLGSGVKSKGPQLLIYESQDLLDWKLLSTLVKGEQDAQILPGSNLGFGRNFECSSFFTIDHKDYLICGIEEDSNLTNRHAARYILWMSGNLQLDSDRKPRFIIDTLGRLDHGILYAAHVFRGASSEVLQLGWADEDKNNLQREQGWAGCLALPRNISQIKVKTPRSLPSDMSMWKVNPATNTMTTLGIKPANQVKGLRSGSKHYSLSSLSELRSKNFEMKARFTRLRGNETLIFNVRQSIHDLEVTRIVFAIGGNTVTVDRTLSSLENGNKVPEIGVFELLNFGTAQKPMLEDLEVRIFVDNSIIEVYANDRFALTSRIYPSTQDATRASVDFRAVDGSMCSDVSHIGFDCWEGLAAAWPGRKMNGEVSEKSDLRKEVETPNLGTQAIAA